MDFPLSARNFDEDENFSNKGSKRMKRVTWYLLLKAKSCLLILPPRSLPKDKTRDNISLLMWCPISTEIGKEKNSKPKIFFGYVSNIP